MAKKKQQDLSVIDYGDEKQTIPVYIPDRRYRALKSLALQKNKPLNQFIRDVIEEAYRKELDRIENDIILHGCEHESTSVSSKAHERMKMVG